jgi:hypothetical protein
MLLMVSGSKYFHIIVRGTLYMINVFIPTNIAQHCGIEYSMVWCSAGLRSYLLSVYTNFIFKPQTFGNR